MVIVRGRHYLTGRVYDFHLGDGRIQAIRSPGSEQATLGSEDHWVAPGLIELQINGHRGVSFTSPDLTAADVHAAASQLAEAGVVAFLPTVTTGPHALLEASLHTIAQACEEDGPARERVLGIHLEGPYISPVDGPRGAHSAEHVRNPDWDEFTNLQSAAGGRIRLVTLAPELPNALDFIRRATSSGVLVALGHHAATGEQIEAAVNAGAVLSTHLGNGAHSELPRHPNYIWEQLAHDGLMASIIVDGCHLPPAVVKSFYRVKGPERLILVTDAVWATGMPAGRYQWFGRDVEVRAEGPVRLVGTPFLAGSTLGLCQAIDNVTRFAGASLGDAVRMATENPARLLNVDSERGFLKTGARADLVLLQPRSGHYDLALTVIGGKVAYQA